MIYAFIKTIEVSSIRFEKPHSLSYHANTLASLPSLDTLVWVESKIQEYGLWLKSMDTNCSVLYWIIFA